jgi:hypothetical protein
MVRTEPARKRLPDGTNSLLICMRFGNPFEPPSPLVVPRYGHWTCIENRRIDCATGEPPYVLELHMLFLYPVICMRKS